MLTSRRASARSCTLPEQLTLRKNGNPVLALRRQTVACNSSAPFSMAGIPSLGFGPGDEKTAHMMNECVPLEDVVRATEFYALLLHFLRGSI